MSGDMDLVVLRELVGGVLNDFAGLWRHQDIGTECERLGLPEPPPEGECSKRVRVARSLAALPDAGLTAVAERIVAGTIPLASGPAARFAIEDVLWAGRGAPEVPKRVRREIARDLDRVLDVLTRKADRFMALLEGLWDVNDSQLGFFARDLTSLRGQIEQHVLRNLGDWTAEDLFEQLAAFDAGDGRFGRFLEGLVSADLIPDETAQRAVADVISPRLREAGAELRETGSDGGYPVFSVVPVSAALHRQAKNLVFASQMKPDIRISDAISNDIEILLPIRSSSTTGRSAVTASGGVTCRSGGRTPGSSVTMRRPSGRCTRGSPVPFRAILLLSGTCSTSTTRFTAPQYPTSPRCCPRYGCTGTLKRFASAAQLLCWATAWISCSCCPTASGSSSRSTDPAISPATTGSPTPPDTPTAYGPTGTSSSADMRYSDSVPLSSKTAKSPAPCCGGSSPICSVASA
jgi:AbiJ-like protein